MTSTRPRDLPANPSIPAVHALHLLEALAEYGVDEDELFRGTGLSRELLSGPGARLDIHAVATLFARAEQLSGRPDLGLQLGLRMRASSHGFLGFAVMTSANVREALELATRYAPTRTDALSLRLEESGDQAALLLEELVDLGSARTHLLLALLTGIWQIGNTLTGRTLRARVELRIDEPSYLQQLRHLFPGDVRFRAPHNRVLLDRETLALPLVMADATSQQLAREQCERELGAMGEASVLESRVRALIPASPAGFRTADEVARKLGMSTRTLKRRLSGHGLRYSDLVDSQRRERALALLRQSDLNIDQVAEQLGYADTANFVRAFRRWMGTTPAAFRRERLG